MELDALAQFDCIDLAILAYGVGISQDTGRLIVCIHSKQRLVDMGTDSAHNVGIDTVNIQTRRICCYGDVQLCFITYFPCWLCGFCPLSRPSGNRGGGLLLRPAGLAACGQHHGAESQGQQSGPFPVFHNSKTFLSDRYRNP